MRPDGAQPVLRLRGVRKSYGHGVRRRWALAGLDLDVPSGACYGLLGVNGSGKTTAVRIATGLAAADAGDIEVLGQPLPSGLSRVAGSIGVALGEAHLFPTFSGEQNLQFVQRLRPASDWDVAWALDLVGLAGDAHRPVRGYSTGMRQRLALAAAVLGRPRLVVLDEPERGLDPIVRRDLEEVLRLLLAQGTTVLMSSHQLDHVKRVCTHVGVLRAGRCVAQGPMEDVLRLGGGAVEVVVDDRETAGTALRAAGAVVEMPPTALDRGSPSRLRVQALDPRAVARVLAGAGVFPHELIASRGALEGLLEGETSVA